MSNSPDSHPDLQSNTNGWRARLDRVRGTAGWQRAAQVGTSRRTKRIGIGVLIFLVVFGLLGAFGGPPLLHYLAQTQLSKLLERPVSVSKISINPYTLRLDVDQLHIAERDGKTSFVDIGHLHVNASWSSVFRRAPVIEELSIDAPHVRIVRTAEQRFNFSDIVDKLTQPDNPPKPKSNEPARFVFANLQLTNGAIDFVDQPLGEQHKVDGLQIGVPFLASLPAAVDIFVQPLLAARIDGAPLHFAGKTKPFADSLESNLNVKVDGLDLPRYLGYVPGPLPVRVPRGKLTTDLTIDFQKPKSSSPALRVRGTAGLDNLEVVDTKNAPLVAAKQVRATLSDVRPLDNVFHLDALTLDGVRVDATRGADGAINFAQLGGKPAPAEAKPATPQPAPTAKPKPLDVVVTKLQLASSTVHWRDATTQPAAELTLEDLHGDIGVRTLGGPTTLDVGAKLAQGGTLNVKGNTSLEKNTGELELKLDDVKLLGAGPYLRQAGAPQLQNGALSADGKIALDFGPDKFNVRAEPLTASLADLSLGAATGKDTPLRAKLLRADVKSFDLAARTLALNEVRADGLQIDALRKKDGTTTLTLLDREQTAAGKSAAPAKSSAKSTAPAEKPWAVTVQTLRLDNSAVGFEDQSNSRPVKVRVEPLNVVVQNASTDLGKPVNVQIGAGLGAKGKLDVHGEVVPQPLKADLRVNSQNLSLAGFDPYLDKSLNAAITSALLSMDGRLVFNQGKALTVSYQGNATLGNVRLQDRVSSDDFLRWRSLALNRIQANFDGTTPRVRVGAVALSTFYARVIINPNGRLNLQDIRVQPTEERRSLTQSDPASSASAAAASAPAAAPVVASAPIAAPASAVTVTATGPTPKAGGTDLRVDAITLQDGNIRFTDNFVKPNYTANLTAIGGTIGTISTAAGQTPADVTLRGSVDGTAPVDIHGKVNPLAPTAFVDLTAKANGVELTNLTPYSAKYAGYPITKGKLTMDLHYLLDQGKLTADNHIFIDQLTFGDRVESKDATNLPVRLAVALLKNSRGEIDVRVPVSGSLDDPQFSIGGVILRAFVNLIARAVTAPFSLLASAFGGSGGEELGYIEFDPGTSNISPATEAKLDKLATALKDRPALKVDIVGRVDPEFDRDGLRREVVNRQIREQKLKDAGDAAEADTTVKPEEENKYLERAYKAAKFPKPRNVIGLAKSLPPDEMRKLMETNVQVTDSDLRELAQRRANAVHVALAERVEPGRLFVVAPKLDAAGIKDKGKTTRVDFALK
ncbi:hypothetical protein LMG19083_01317 [Ralstonia psammae]|uniref:DUF748 domain-containing protein n=1 Tax=Ralstonia psammae TaxID=3058598 RepID=A0ABM9J7Z8_9RALS|nr:DUF748 domain-containing protein [Ralstonia sp. LMG 19083]CAJ0785576.1 hypothetical protein LMG19083_01317 [Ralstonia sp. LMG 19083]